MFSPLAEEKQGCCEMLYTPEPMEVLSRMEDIDFSTCNVDRILLFKADIRAMTIAIDSTTDYRNFAASTTVHRAGRQRSHSLGSASRRVR